MAAKKFDDDDGEEFAFESETSSESSSSNVAVDSDVDYHQDDDAEEEEDASKSSEDENDLDREEIDRPVVPVPDRKSHNVAALVRGTLVVTRQPLIPRLLSVSDGAAVARKPFKPPSTKGYADDKAELSRRLQARKRFVPWASRTPLASITNLPKTPTFDSDEHSEIDVSLPPGVEPLVLWQPDGGNGEIDDSPQIEVDHLLVRYLRPHQREGVQFMFDCVSGLSGSDGISGCILADDMGLGKTLQSITLLYTLLRQGFDGKPMVKKALIVTPTSLVSNWESEINKWLNEKLHYFLFVKAREQMSYRVLRVS